MLYMAIVRSPEAHAKITSIDTSRRQGAARHRRRASPARTSTGDFAGPIPMVWAPPGVEINTPEHWPLARGEVKHVGDAVAVVVGTDKYGVVDAAEDVIVEYDPRPVVVDPEAALEDGSPLVWEEFGTNKTHNWAIAGGDIEAAIADADVVDRAAHRQPPHRRRRRSSRALRRRHRAATS